MIRQITVNKVRNFDKDKEGNQLTGKFGPYFKYALDCDEYPTKTLWGIGSKQVDWKQGDKIEIDIEEKGEYLNFKLPKKEDALGERVSSLEKRIIALEKGLEERFAKLKSDLVFDTTGKFQTTDDYNKMSEEVDLSDIPF